MKQDIVRDVLERDTMAELWLRHIVLNAVDQIMYNHYQDDTVPVSIKDNFFTLQIQSSY